MLPNNETGVYIHHAFKGERDRQFPDPVFQIDIFSPWIESGLRSLLLKFKDQTKPSLRRFE